MKKHFYLTIFVLFLFYNSLSSQNVVTLNELNLSADSYWNGSDGSGSFISSGVTFYNNYNAAWFFWSGFAYSNKSDSITPGYDNQYSAITGKGFGGSGNYAVSYIFEHSRIRLSAPDTVQGMYVTNSTYAYMAMKNGDAVSKKFGGAAGSDPDYFRLLISGFRANGDSVGTVTAYLADFRDSDPAKDFLLKTWKWVDLKSLGEVVELRFRMESSDVGDYGINTPTYFCMDNLTLKKAVTSTVAERDSEEGFQAYPNPFTDRLNVRLPEGEWYIEIRNLQGSLVYRSEESRMWNFLLENPDRLQPGIYFLTIKDKSGYMHTQKLLKSR